MKILSLEEIEKIGRRLMDDESYITVNLREDLLATARAYWELMERVRNAVAQETSMDNELQKHWTKFLR